MDTLEAYAMSRANHGKEHRVFDWEQAARLIKKGRHKEASAGLIEDWSCTAGIILEDGRIPDEHFTFLSSNWATPGIELDGCIIQCFRMQSEVREWGSSTFWPEPARTIMGFLRCGEIQET